MKREQMLQLMKYYEQKYFTHDEPVPFKDNLMIYPIKVRQYYEFYFNILCFKMNKNEDPEGVAMSNLGYLLYKMKDKETGATLNNQLINLLELVFHVKNGLKCPKCGDTITFDQINKEIEQIKKISDETTRELILRKYLEDISFCEKCSEKTQKEDTSDASIVDEILNP